MIWYSWESWSPLFEVGYGLGAVSSNFFPMAPPDVQDEPEEGQSKLTFGESRGWSTDIYWSTVAKRPEAYSLILICIYIYIWYPNDSNPCPRNTDRTYPVLRWHSISSRHHCVFFITATLTEKAGGPRRGRGAAGFFGRTAGSRGLRPQWDMICASLNDSIETYWAFTNYTPQVEPCRATNGARYSWLFVCNKTLRVQSNVHILAGLKIMHDNAFFKQSSFHIIFTVQACSSAEFALFHRTLARVSLVMAMLASKDGVQPLLKKIWHPWSAWRSPAAERSKSWLMKL